MPNNEATGRVRIIKVPAGEAPLIIRRLTWLGMTLPCYPHIGYLYHGSERGLFSGEKIGGNRRGVIVPQDQALVIVEQNDPDIAKWWTERGFPQPGGNFFFGENEIEIIRGVTPAPTRVFDDMETGRWRQVLP